VGDRARVDYKKNVVNLGLVSFFTDVSTEMILGVLPLFIINELGASRALLGIIEGLGELVSNGSRTVSGALSDKLGKRKILIITGYGLSTIAKPLFALSTFWAHALAVRVGDRIGKGIRTSPRDALLSDSVKEKVGRAFGIHRSLDQAGAIVGPLLAFALVPLIGVRGIFWFSFIPGIIAVLILVFLVKEKSIAPRSASVLSNFRNVLKGRFLLLIGILTIFSLGAFNFSFVLLKGMEADVAASLIPVIYAVINITHTAIGLPAGILSDRIGGERTLIIGYSLFFLVSIIGFAYSGSFVVFVMAAIFGLYFGIAETVQRALVPKYIESELRATAYGVYYLFIGVSFLIANTVFGSLWDILGSQFAFSYSLIISGIAIGALALFSWKYHA
jgi:MFS family permease